MLDPRTLSGKPAFTTRKRPRQRKKPAGFQVTRPRATGRYEVTPPTNLVAQVARFMAGDTTGYRTDWPTHLLAIATEYMQAAHFAGIEHRGSAWVERTKKLITRKKDRAIIR